MPLSQTYVSNELCHFVGRGKTADEQYDLLVNKILKAGALTHGPLHDLAAPRTLGLDLSKPISTDEMLAYQVVCFCDIPIDDLELHVSKYSQVGLSFRKEFLIDMGACPVFYVANESPVPATEVFNPPDLAKKIEEAKKKGFVDRALYFDTTVRAIIDMLAALDMMCFDEANAYFKGLNRVDFESRIKMLLDLSDDQITAMAAALKTSAKASSAIRRCTDFLLNYVFSYVKCFDAKRIFDDDKHFYMEREWRVANNVAFTLDNVCRVFFPERYARQFRHDVPDYFGQITFLD